MCFTGFGRDSSCERRCHLLHCSRVGRLNTCDKVPIPPDRAVFVADGRLWMALQEHADMGHDEISMKWNDDGIAIVLYCSQCGETIIELEG